MNHLASWPLAAVLLASLAWIALWVALLASPWIHAARWVRTTVEETGIAAVSFSIASTLWRLGVIFVPPLLLLVAWLRLRQAA